ncbi:hypothetical protein TIFTF001_002419 [Ficus carica]|uniref:Auxilin-like protein 1 n=1 Tax=Ficus carica TaxID=3494 RepID=A0AA88CTP3_FICCA|nr:hypothetical protein TIFTF001_002419 [Ficus carica]
MENLSHSRHPNRAAAALSKKIYGSAGGFPAAATAKNLYDDVYGGPPKFGVSNLSPRMEDYSEIFGSFQTSRASSIPVLDLPAVDEAEVFFDVRSSSFDYSEVFGGFDGLDFAVSHEELVDQSKDGDGNSSDEAWSPAEFESLSEESDISGRDQCFSNGGPRQSFDGTTEFSISYHKANQIISEDMASGMTRVTQLHAVPGFTYMVDSPLQRIEDQNASLQVTDDSNLGVDFSVDKVKAKHLKKTMSHPANVMLGGHAFEKDLRPQKEYGQNGSCHSDAFLGISEISLRTQPSELPPPSRPPPAVEGKKGYSSKLVSHRSSLASEGISGDCSPPFFDVEVDASSSAAASAAAIKEAMEKAQAKIKSAKELMEKKKEGLQRSHKSGSRKDMKVKEMKEMEGKTGTIIDGSNKAKDERLKGACEREDTAVNVLVREKQKVSKTGLEVSESLEGESTFVAAGEFVKDKPENESWSSGGYHKVDEASEWKEATEFFEIVTTDESKKVFEQANSKKMLVQNIESHEHGQKKAALESFEKKAENDGKVKPARKDHELGEFEEKREEVTELCGHKEDTVKAKAAKEAFEQKDCEKKVKVTQEVCKRGENKSVTTAKHIVDKRVTGAGQSVKEKETKSKVEKAIKQKENKKKSMEAETMIEIEKKLKLSHKKADNEERHKEAFIEVINGISFEKPFEQAENEKKVHRVLEEEENEKWLKEILDKVEKERRQQEAFTQQENEKRLKQSLEQDKSKKKQIEVLELEDKNKREETHQREENDEGIKSVYGQKETRKHVVVSEQEENGKILTDVQENEERHATLCEASEQLDTCNMSKEILEQEDTKRMAKDTVDPVGEKGLDQAHGGMEKDEHCNEVKLVKPSQVHVEGEDLVQSDTQPTQLACDRDEDSGKVKTSQETHAHEDKKDMKAEPLNSETQPAVGRKNESIDDNVEASSISGKHHFGMEDSKEALLLRGSVKKTSGEIEIEPEVSEKESVAFEIENGMLGERLKTFGKSQGNFELPHLDNQVKKAGEAIPVVREPNIENIKSSSQMGYVPDNQDREFAYELKERSEYRTQAQASSNKEEKERTVPTQARAMVEARERLEKACAEAREKSLAGKAAMEARIRAERAAVERATAEARERATEKAMAERAAFEARDRIQRSVSDKFTASSRNNGMRQSTSSSDLQDSQFQSTGLPRYQYSSVYAERYEGIEGESAQRCKARMERHRRTAERAAKALAEKNMRDLLAQREQAERHRLAETLDADVRRWSSGKEGNLRALLSTLQYILGPDSGWQPIPLTEVITSAAVKKAYRKATLCVHPDKLQQRGASIQQKKLGTNSTQKSGNVQCHDAAQHV